MIATGCSEDSGDGIHIGDIGFNDVDDDDDLLDELLGSENNPQTATIETTETSIALSSRCTAPSYAKPNQATLSRQQKHNNALEEHQSRSRANNSNLSESGTATTITSTTVASNRESTFDKPNQATLLRQEDLRRLERQRRLKREAKAKERPGIIVSRNPSLEVADLVPKAYSKRSTDPRLPTVSTRSSGGGASGGSVFDRLYRTRTASTTMAAIPAGELRAATSPKKIGDSETVQKVFSRLYINETVASRGAKYSAPRRRKDATHHSPTTPDSSKSPSFRPNSEKSVVYSPKKIPKIKLCLRSKFHPQEGFTELQPKSLGKAFFVEFCNYGDGLIDNREFVSHLILALFKKDFTIEHNWTLNTPPSIEQQLIQPCSHDNNDLSSMKQVILSKFYARMTATYHDSPSHHQRGLKNVASCEGTIIFLSSPSALPFQPTVYPLGQSCDNISGSNRYDGSEIHIDNYFHRVDICPDR